MAATVAEVEELSVESSQCCPKSWGCVEKHRLLMRSGPLDSAGKRPQLRSPWIWAQMLVMWPQDCSLQGANQTFRADPPHLSLGLNPYLEGKAAVFRQWAHAPVVVACYHDSRSRIPPPRLARIRYKLHVLVAVASRTQTASWEGD